MQYIWSFSATSNICVLPTASWGLQFTWKDFPQSVGLDIYAIICCYYV